MRSVTLEPAPARPHSGFELDLHAVPQIRLL